MVRRNQAVLAAVARRLEESPEQVLPTLRLLADPDALPERLEPSAVEVARRVNSRRLQERLDALRAASLTTGDVRELLGGVSRQAVAGRVASGSLLSMEVAGRSWFPDWQFGPDGPWPRLAEVLRVLVRDGRGVLAADALMRRPLPEEGGSSAADLMAVGRVDSALHYVAMAGH